MLPSRPSTLIRSSAASYIAPASTGSPTQIKAFYHSLPDFSPTPLVPLRDLAKELGVKNIFVKSETSRLGLPSFKLLGAGWAMRQAVIQRAKLSSNVSHDELRAAVREHGIRFAAATDGNHGRAVARMGGWLGARGTRIFVPKGLHDSTIKGIEGEGAEVVVVEENYDKTVKVAHQCVEETDGGMLIEGTAFEGYEDVPRWTVEGYTTLLHELPEQLHFYDCGSVPNLIVVPVGVGSLAQSVVTYCKSSSSGAQAKPLVMSVEPHAAASLYTSLKAGGNTTIETSSTIMTGLECGTVSKAAWPILEEGVDVAITISDLECHKAILELKLVGIEAGPCGAAALAGLRHVAETEPEVLRLNEDSVVVLICTEGIRSYETPDPIEEASPSI